MQRVSFAIPSYVRNRGGNARGAQRHTDGVVNARFPDRSECDRGRRLRRVDVSSHKLCVTPSDSIKTSGLIIDPTGENIAKVLPQNSTTGAIKRELGQPHSSVSSRTLRLDVCSTCYVHSDRIDVEPPGQWCVHEDIWGHHGWLRDEDVDASFRRSCGPCHARATGHSSAADFASSRAARANAPVTGSAGRTDRAIRGP